MKRLLIITLVILISFVALAFSLKTDVPVAVEVDEKSNISLNNKTHVFDLRSKESFNAIAIRLLTYTKLMPGKTITFSIKESPNGRILAESILREGWVHGEYYKFGFVPLEANKTYYLVVKGQRGVPYRATKTSTGQLLHKLYNRKSLAYIVYYSSVRADRDWFRFGPLYLTSIGIYIILLAILIGSLITKLGFETDN